MPWLRVKRRTSECRVWMLCIKRMKITSDLMWYRNNELVLGSGLDLVFK